MQTIVAGRRRVALNEIMRKTKTHFYCPIPFTIYQDSDAYYSTVYITGQTDQIQEAADAYVALVQSMVIPFSC